MGFSPIHRSYPGVVVPWLITPPPPLELCTGYKYTPPPLELVLAINTPPPRLESDGADLYRYTGFISVIGGGGVYTPPRPPTQFTKIKVVNSPIIQSSFTSHYHVSPTYLVSPFTILNILLFTVHIFLNSQFTFHQE